jgi:hypothetical protein
MIVLYFLMPFFYRGAGPGSFWHVRDARLSGFSPHSPGATASISRLMNHIARASIVSPYVSLSRSFGIARAYGLVGPAGMASGAVPGYVYEIEAERGDCVLIDPVKLIVEDLPDPDDSLSYQHDGEQDFLKGVVEGRVGGYAVVFPPGSAGTPRQPRLTEHLEALVRALRDAEIMALGNIPASLVRNRYEVS